MPHDPKKPRFNTEKFTHKRLDHVILALERELLLLSPHERRIFFEQLYSARESIRQVNDQLIILEEKRRSTISSRATDETDLFNRERDRK